MAGTSLAGSTIGSTFQGILKTTDNATVNSTLRTISDGTGVDSALQVSTAGVNSTGTLASAGNFAVNTNKFNVAAATGNTTVAGTFDTAGNFSVATNKFTVAAASGNTAIAGTLNVTGACVFSSTGAFTGNLSTSQTFTCRAFVQNDAAGTSSWSGQATFGNQVTFNALAQFNSSVAFSGLVTFSGGVSASTLTATSTSSLASASATSLTTTGAVTVGGNLSVNGNATLGDASGDSVTINAATVTSPNIATKASPTASDLVLLRDAADSNRWKWGSASTVVRGFSYSETAYRDNYSPTAWADRFIQSSAGVDWTVAHTFATVGNTATIEADICLGANMAVSVIAGIVEVSTGNTVGMAVTAIYQSAHGTNIRITGRFTSTAASHSFKIRLRCDNGGASFSINPSAGDIGYSPVPAWWAPKSSITVTETA